MMSDEISIKVERIRNCIMVYLVDDDARYGTIRLQCITRDSAISKLERELARRCKATNNNLKYGSRGRCFHMFDDLKKVLIRKYGQAEKLGYTATAQTID